MENKTENRMESRMIEADKTGTNRKRIRDYGIEIGHMKSGPINKWGMEVEML